MFSESESGSDGEKHADVEICGIGKVACDSSSKKGKFQRGKLATKTSRNSKGKASQYQDEKIQHKHFTVMLL